MGSKEGRGGAERRGGGQGVVVRLGLLLLLYYIRVLYKRGQHQALELPLFDLDYEEATRRTWTLVRSPAVECGG